MKSWRLLRECTARMPKTKKALEDKNPDEREDKFNA